MTTPEGVRSVRAARGLTQGDLAALLRVDRKTIQRWESGATPLPGPAAILLDLIEAGSWPPDG